jgi:pimeloyl-ACP methyl ester carboxylesterase
MRMFRILILISLMTVPVRKEPQPTRFATSKDGTRIAYDVTGSGPAVMLLHGGGQTRRAWHDAGYVTKLASELTVIAADLRGNGESDKPAATAAYAIDRHTDDLVAVADAAGISRFALWGYSYGANIGRYLASRSDRVRSMVYIGIPFGPAAEGDFRKMIVALGSKWKPIIEADRKGTLDVQALPDSDRAAWQRGTVAVSIAWLSAMLEFPPVEPRDMRCPTLWLVGTENAPAMQSTIAYQESLAGTPVSLVLVDGLTHQQELEKIDQVLPTELEFTRAHE